MGRQSIVLLVPEEKSGGVYDFACKLQEKIGIDNCRLEYLSEKGAENWLIKKNSSVYLQLSGYGFSRYGAPRWLYNCLKEQRNSIKQLGIYFHEIYAFGPPWRTSFWVSPFQQYLANRFVQLSDFWLTSRLESAEWLQRFCAARPHGVLPVFSTIGESESILLEKKRKIIIFGNPLLRLASYHAAGDELFKWAKKNSLEVHDIGSPFFDSTISKRLLEFGVFQHGRISSQQVRQQMSEAMFGLITYPNGWLAKSSVFAAYCAHGICPVLLSERQFDTDGLTSNNHYLPGIPKEMNMEHIHSVRYAALDWYRQHDIESHIQALQDFNFL